MFKVVESVFNPIKLIPESGFKFVPGSIVSFAENSYKCQIGGKNSIGFAYNYLDTTNNIKINDFIIVWYDRLIFRTDVYSKNAVCPYITGADLYVDNQGILTTDKEDINQVSVGRIITGPNNKRAWIESIWY